MTHNTPHTPEPLSIAIMRKELVTHQQTTIECIEKGMFYTARKEIDHCLILTGKIGSELVRGV